MADNMIRNCSNCNIELTYSSRSNLLRANRVNSLCRKCGCNKPERLKKISETHLGKKRDASVGEKISKIKMGHIVSEETRVKIRNAQLGEKGNMYGKENKWGSHSDEAKQKMSEFRKGKKLSDETRQKMSLSAIKRIENGNGSINPNYNPAACKIIDDYGTKHGYNFQHAENGGEVQILRYWLDGYDKDKNVVIEYYEKKHKNTTEQDARRKQEIVDHLDCKFIELREENYIGN